MDKLRTERTALVVDDERLAREELSYLLKDFPEIEVLQTASNGLEAVNLIAKLEPDLVFLDVQMPGLDGLAVIRKLRDEGARMPHFVLATAFDQYAVEAFRVEAIDYLLKPVEKEHLAESVARAKRAIDEKQHSEETSPEAAESRFLEHRPQPGLAGLRTEPQSNLLREGVRGADRGGGRVQEWRHRIVLDVLCPAV